MWFLADVHRRIAFLNTRTVNLQDIGSKTLGSGHCNGHHIQILFVCPSVPRGQAIDTSEESPGRSESGEIGNVNPIPRICLFYIHRLWFSIL